jgi:hypothetical protein
MPKESGIGWTTFSVDDDGGNVRVIKNDITDVAIAIPAADKVSTGLDKSAEERQRLLQDAQVTANGIYNPTLLTGAHAVLSTVNHGVNRTFTMTVSAQTLAMEMLLESYELNRADDGSLGFASVANLGNGTVPAWS